MKKSEMFRINLEADDRTKEELLRDKPAKKGVDFLRGQGTAEPPMDTDYQEEREKPPSQLRFNLGFSRMAQGLEPNPTDPRFKPDILFEAAASGDVQKLEGLEDFLRTNMKKLSDTFYQSYGKTPLIKALMHLKDGKNETVDEFIKIAKNLGDLEKLVNASHTSNYYKGQTALHVAIERRSMVYVQLLVSSHADVHAKASGKFFQPHDGPHFYFGELPLSLAACTNQPEMVDYLLTNEIQRADPGQQDSHGNTVLHALVAVADNSEENSKFIISMYDRILKTTAELHPKKKLEDILNDKELSPLLMAAKTGKIWSNIKHLSRKFTEWVYGPVHCSLYDLASVDSCENNSLLEILIYGSDIPNRHEMLQTEPLSQLLQAKWKKFAGGMFFFNFLVYCLYLTVFTIVALYIRSTARYKEFKNYILKDHNNGQNDLSDYLFIAGLLFTLLANVFLFITGITDMRRKRPNLMTLLIDGYYEILFFVQGLFYLVFAGLYIAGRDLYVCFLVLCLALSWVNILYFSRGYEHMGIYSVMIQKMIVSDILRFLFVYIVFLFGFSAAVVTLLNVPPESPKNISKGRTFFTTQSPNEECVKPTYKSFSFTLLELFKFTIGMGDMEFSQAFEYREIFYFLLIGYIILTYILLLNMLIALMNRTVENITKESACIWKLQRAVTILDMEKRLPYCVRKCLRCGVEKKFVTALGNEQRWCFRVEEVNWKNWNKDISKIDEEPGCSDRSQQSGDENNTTWRLRSFRGLIRASRRRQRSESTEMNTLTL
ncbi:Transient receptor potential cation channel subfamily V member 1 [Oryzias melastigma]|uniref:Transient receptor potential cation channel subfamily V member 1 n=1 Tax=Oryzias melastigma TaxID=30732 RepID=A0A834F286_ORYME|nr:Transient receptor potential cation channel subfamily V member 1 [Oryzias melastigma]